MKDKNISTRCRGHVNLRISYNQNRLEVIHHLQMSKYLTLPQNEQNNPNIHPIEILNFYETKRPLRVSSLSGL